MGLITNDPNGTGARGGIDPMGIHVRFGTGDEEGAGQMQPMEPDEIDIAAIHHVDGARFREQQIERVDIVQLAVRDMDEARDVAAQIQQGVHLHRRLGRAEVRPGENRQTQIDGRRVERVDGVGQVQTQAFAGVQLPGLGDQTFGEFGMNTPIAHLVGIGQRRAPHRFAETQVIEFRRLDRQAGFDIAQALPIGQLSKRHGSVLFAAGQRSHPMIAAVPRHNLHERRPRHKIHKLREQRLAGVHVAVSGENSGGIVPANRSSRHRPFFTGSN